MRTDRFEFKTADGNSAYIAVSYECEDGAVVFATPLAASINGLEAVDASEIQRLFKEWTERRLNQIDCGGESA